MTIKIGDKYKTHDGHEVEITDISLKGTHPVFAKIKVWQPINYTLDGKWSGKDHPLDLILGEGETELTGATQGER